MTFISLTEFSSHYLPGHRYGPRAHAARYAFHRQTKNRMMANLVAFVQVRTYKVLILDLFHGQLITYRLISPHSLCAPSTLEPAGQAEYAIV